MTYAQPSDSELLVRLSAGFDPRSGYSMRTQTYDVTFVAVFPEGIDTSTSQINSELQIFGETHLRHARTGERLPALVKSDIEGLSEELSETFKTYKSLITSNIGSSADKLEYCN